ncbi:MAG: hypothetical protein ABSF28_07460 [Terracidiphilus sp.]|jgi:hypothetical protein
MSEYVTLEASDGHKLSAYVARPEGDPIAGLVVVQEIFGVKRTSAPLPMVTRKTDSWPSLRPSSTVFNQASSSNTRAKT